MASVRLLRLHGSSSSSHGFRCELQSVALGNFVNKFVAVSYRWSTSPPIITIDIDDHDFRLNNDLLRLLSRLASFGEQGKETWFWIDAICIDQSNIDERNHQVKLMRQIYASAKQVLVWLGEEENDSDSALDYLNWALDPLNRTRGLWVFAAHLARESSRIRDRDNYSRYARVFQQLLTHRVKQAIPCLLQREYWSRMWIIQEILVGRKVIVLCGSKVMGWAALTNFVVLVSIIQSASELLWNLSLVRDFTNLRGYRLISEKILWGDSPEARGERGQYKRLANLFAGWELDPEYFFGHSPPEHTGRRPIAELISTFSDWECSDPRDKVYALLGICCDDIPVDYHLSVVEVYSVVLRYVILKLGRFRSGQEARSFAFLLARSMQISINDGFLITAQELFDQQQLIQNLPIEFYDWPLLACRADCNKWGHHYFPHYPKPTWVTDSEKLKDRWLPKEVFDGYDERTRRKIRTRCKQGFYRSP